MSGLAELFLNPFAVVNGLQVFACAECFRGCRDDRLAPDLRREYDTPSSGFGAQRGEKASHESTLFANPGCQVPDPVVSEEILENHESDTP